VTLTELLESRDNRRRRQQSWLADANGLTLAVLTIVMPGSVKRDDVSLAVARAAVTALDEEFGALITKVETFDLSTGFESFMLIDAPASEVKRRTCSLEDTHPLGRLFDIDVIDAAGIPMSRTALGVPARKCLLCDDDARVCMRSGRHSYDELLDHICRMVRSYQQSSL